MQDVEEQRNQSPRPRSRGLSRVVRMLYLVAIVSLGWAAWVLAESSVVQTYHGWRLDAAIAEREAAPDHAEAGDATLSALIAVPEWGDLDEGEMIGRIEIERHDVHSLVLSGLERRTLRRAVGHIPRTARPGEEGNVGLADHRDTFFRRLQGVGPGDEIRLSTPHGTFHYRVDTTFVVTPRDVHVLDDPAEGGEMITLVTCYPFHFVGPAPDRFIVQARRILPPTPSAS